MEQRYARPGRDAKTWPQTERASSEATSQAPESPPAPKWPPVTAQEAEKVERPWALMSSVVGATTPAPRPEVRLRQCSGVRGRSRGDLMVVGRVARPRWAVGGEHRAAPPRMMLSG